MNSPKQFVHCKKLSEVLSPTTNTLKVSLNQTIEFVHLFRRLHGTKEIIHGVKAALNPLEFRKKGCIWFSFSVGIRQDLHSPLQWANNQTMKASKHSFKLTYSEFPFRWKLNRGKSSYINRRWKLIWISVR